MPTTDVNGLALHYADTGSGQPLVFLNGLAGDHLYWMGQVRTFSRPSRKRPVAYRCLALDNRDSGQSARAAAPYCVADLADDVAGLLDQLGLEAAHVVGLSLGGMIAQELALRHPRRVRSLFLVGTLARCDDWFYALLDAFDLIRRNVADSGGFFETVLPWLVSPRYFETPARVEWLRALFRQSPHPQPIDGFFRQLDAIRRHDTLDRLREIVCPVLVAVGEDDQVIPPRYSRRLAEHLCEARLVVLPGLGHAPPIEDPQQFNQLLGDFLKSQG